MVSDFRKKKLLHVYNAFFDADRSGSINKADFEFAITKISAKRGWKHGDERHQKLKDKMMKIWEGLQQEADENNDGEVSKEEWTALWDKYAKNPTKASDWQNIYCELTFWLEDTSDDGAIDAQEFSSLYESFGLDKEESIDCFKKMAGGKQKIDWPHFQELWREYFAAEDKEKPGNLIFGCYVCSINPDSHSHSHSH
ncbi:calexcitin-1-like [Plodia interpunctella]|uniref:calexcitin-1-like n=1 Tax=Plodia interpunctella TaxID=58824 RepID=UPI0023685566|nr:calexcitin-1-like [Plodia interpunctella]